MGYNIVQECVGEIPGYKVHEFQKVNLNVYTIIRNSMSTPKMILVSEEELAELRKLKEDLPEIIEKAKEEERKEALERLHRRDKENPEAARERALKRYNRNKDEINAKRREAYQLKKSQKTPGVSFLVESENPSHA